MARLLQVLALRWAGLHHHALLTDHHCLRHGHRAWALVQGPADLAVLC